MAEKKWTTRNKTIFYNKEVKKWFYFAIETLITAILGALIGFFFQGSWTVGFIVFGLLLFSLMIYLIILVVSEHKVSITAIMQSGLSNKRYEDVIKYGYAMSRVLFTSHHNDIRVNLGEYMMSALDALQNEKYNSRKEHYVISIGKEQKTIAQIKSEILIDDIGFSLYLSGDSKNAILNILEGMKTARLQIHEILNNDNISEEIKKKCIYPFVSIIVKGYRHISGIYYESNTSLEYAKHIERIIQVIMSNGIILSDYGVCHNRNKELCDKNVPGMFCLKQNKKSCIRNNIFKLFFEHQQISQSTPKKLETFLELNKFAEITSKEIVFDTQILNMLNTEQRTGIVSEQCYTWARNIVKKLQRIIHMQTGYFVSDEEWQMEIEEAKVFAQLYLNGGANIKTDENSTETDFYTIANKDSLGKRELRYLSLWCEISLIDLYQKSIFNESDMDKNDKIEDVIIMLLKTRDLCRGQRTDLFVRASAYLIKAYALEYQLNYRYSTAEDIRNKRSKKIMILQKKIKSIRNETREYRHKDDYLVENEYKIAKKFCKLCRKDLKKKIKCKKKNTNKDLLFPIITRPINTSFHLYDKLPLDEITQELIDSIKKHWRIS